MVRLVNTNVFALEPGTATIQASYVAENPYYFVFGEPTVTRTATATITVAYGSGGVHPTHRWSFNEPADSPIDHDSIGGLDATNQWTAKTDGLGHLVLDGTSNISLQGTVANVNYPFSPTGTNGLFSMAVTGPGFIAGLTNATFEAWFSPSNNLPYGPIFDCGADVDSTVSGTDTNGLTNCYVTLIDYYAADASAVAAVLQPTNPGDAYEPPFILSAAPIPTNLFTHVALVWDQAAGYGVIYTNGVISSTNPSPILYPLSSVNDASTIFGKSHYIGQPDQTGPNDGTTGPPLAGQSDELRVWSGAMDSNQVHASYLAGPNTLPGPTLTITTNAAGLFIGYPYWAARSYGLYSSPTLVDPVWTPVATTPTTNVVNGAFSSVERAGYPRRRQPVLHHAIARARNILSAGRWAKILGEPGTGAGREEHLI